MDSDHLISVDRIENEKFLSSLSLLTPTADLAKKRGENPILSPIFPFKFKLDAGPTSRHKSTTRPGSFLS